MMAFSRGDIHLVNFNPAKGGEIGKLRPAVIVSDTIDNDILETVIVIPLSTVIEKDAMPYRFPISIRDKLEQVGDACVNEIRALSKQRVKDRLGKLSKEELETLQGAMCTILYG